MIVCRRRCRQQGDPGPCSGAWLCGRAAACPASPTTQPLSHRSARAASTLTRRSSFYIDMYARHDVIIESACLWLEEADSIDSLG